MMSAIRRAARRLGVEVAGHRPATSAALRLRLLLDALGVDVVVDAGAHTGQYGRWLRELGYAGEIVSIEPQAAANARLRHAARRDPRWHVLAPLALGDADGAADLTIAADSESSSLAAALPALLAAAPGAAGVGTERVPLRRLDSLAPALLARARAPFLKLDVQGYERRVLAGAARTLPLLRGLQLELSLAPLYAGEATLDEVAAELGRAGFALHGLTPGFTDPRDGRVLQVDALFWRADGR
jgi:FkbM family methyltransferase